MIQRPTANLPEKQEKLYRVPALERAFDILDLVRSSGFGRTASELSSLLGLPYSTTFYLIKTMERRGFVRRDADNKKFYLGAKLMSFQRGIAPTDIEIRDAASVYLDRIASYFKLTTHTAIRDGTEAVYIDRREAPGYIKISTWIGQRLPLHCTAVGKSLLLFSSPEEISSILGQTHLTKFTELTIPTLKQLVAHLKRSARQCYTVDDRESESEGACIAAPILNSDGKVVAAIGVSGTIYQFAGSSIGDAGAYMRNCAREISQQLGFPGVYPGE